MSAPIADDVEANEPHALGMVVREDVTDADQFPLDRASRRLAEAANGRIGLAGIDTRALTRRIRDRRRAQRRDRASAEGKFDIAALLEKARAWPGLEGMDLAKHRSPTETQYGWDGGVWRWARAMTSNPPRQRATPHVVAIDYGAKHNIFRNLVEAGATRDRGARDRELRGGHGARSPTACSCRTAPAIPPRPANMRCR